MTARVAEVSWVLRHEEDLEADFFRFYRLDWRTLSGPRYFSLAQRVSAYGGVMTAVVEGELQAAGEALEVPPPGGDDTLPPLPAGAVVVPESAMADMMRR